MHLREVVWHEDEPGSPAAGARSVTTTAWGMRNALVKRLAYTVASAVRVRRSGLVAARLVRLGHHMLWHVLDGTVCA